MFTGTARVHRRLGTPSARALDAMTEPFSAIHRGTFFYRVRMRRMGAR